MQAYREAFSRGETRLLLTPDSDFFRYFRSIPTSVRPRCRGDAGGRRAAVPAGVTPPAAALRQRRLPSGTAPRRRQPPAADGSRPRAAAPGRIPVLAPGILRLAQ